MNIAWPYLSDIQRAQLLHLCPDLKEDYNKQRKEEEEHESNT